MLTDLNKDLYNFGENFNIYNLSTQNWNCTISVDFYSFANMNDQFLNS